MKTVFRVRTHRVVYLLNRLVRAGVSVDRIERKGDLLTFRTSARERLAVERVLTEGGFDRDLFGFLGARAFFRGLFSRPFLVVSVLVTLVALFFFNGFVYDVSIRGNRFVNTAEIRAVLSENRVDGFTAKGALDLPRIKREIAALDGVSFASVKVVGTRLEVEVKESLPFVTPDVSDYSPISSGYAAVVTRVVAESGTPRVSSGDRVEAGDLLIEPIYAFTEGDAPAPARGEVWGVVTHSLEVVLPAVSVGSVRTGESASRRSVSFFGKSVVDYDPPPYAEYVCEERLLYHGFGVKVTERVYSEIASRTLYHDFDLEARTVLLRAAAELLLSVPCDAAPRGTIRVTQKKLDNILYTVLYYTTEQRIDSLSLVP